MDGEVFRWVELVQWAGTPSKARTLVATGRWRRVLRGAYAPAWLADSVEVRLAALRLVLPVGAVPSHRTALWLLGVARLSEELDVTCPRGRHLVGRPGLRVHAAALPDSELCDHGGLTVTSAARAVADVCRAESLTEAVVVGDAALRAGATTVEQVEAVLARAAGLRGVRRARAVVPHLEARSESPMESRLRMRLVLGGVPRPQAQWDVHTRDGHAGRADFHLDGVLLEYDGRLQRLDKAEFVAERRRQTVLAETGLELRRLTSHDVYVRPAAAVCGEVLRAVVQARGRDRAGLRTGPDTLRRPASTPAPTLAEAQGCSDAA